MQLAHKITLLPIPVKAGYFARAWLQFFADIKAGERIAPECQHPRYSLHQQGVKLAYPPTFKRKHHDCDHNAALNLKRLATETALPVASPSVNLGAASGMLPVQSEKSLLSVANSVCKTVRGRKRTVRTFAHGFDSSL